ncbi:MAG: molybdopterin converting factor [Phycisphaerae bacterium]|nr:molybdopterin converting factor [Phycisphaerae bacterium]
MKIMYINNDGAGFADYIDISPNTTIEALFQQKMPHDQTSDFLIRVNRQPVPRDYCLQGNDRVTITPTKIDGAKPGYI